MQLVANGYALDAVGLAAELGNERTANTVLLGVLSNTLSFPVDGWLEVLDHSVPRHTVEINRTAFLKGRAWAETWAAPPGEAEPTPQPPRAEAGAPIRLEILRAWCKGCDICVKMCPERCLALDERQIAVLTDAAACTGCRVCEWLCPDFAITVHCGDKAA